MKTRVLFFMALTVLAMLVVSGCTRSASTSPTALATPTSEEIPFPVDVAQRMTEVAQQTQMAMPTPEGGLVTPVVVETPAPTPAPTNTPVIIPTPTRPATYTLQPGEWPLCIARRYNLDINTFFEANGLTMNSRPAAGTVLKIPQDGGWSAGDRALKPHPAQYTVKAGDTIYSIACDFGDVFPESIIAANNLQSPYTLTPGQVLQIP
ncbi:LysM peptidoglycan-binding domain-containing protein [Thermanaerothrix sp.]|jgi:LysM repeat protein|uniref:LysM peptidoglycan-binding domain-containing protein n=1 Tax=Thermanaerothrix sp. TaxID=2972675 RepID=UPI002ADD3CCF|nr:LysM peptidoglycan-binding domain-containing protein [Thermanaerothrix sp.]